jgi:membrane protease YdiL (CAAX protease family)
MDVDPFRPLADRPEGPSQAAGQPTLARRLVALLEVLICSDYPTQAALGATFSAFGYGPFSSSGDLRLGFVVGVSLVDTGLLVGLILFFLRAHGEEPQALFLGPRPVRREIALGVWPLAVMAVVLGIGLLAAVQRFFPVLHTVEHNPLEALIRTPADRWWFALVVVVAGGFREEIQRAFLLHRFEQLLGGPALGLVVSSVAFGAGHYAQGADAALVVGVLGAFWGAVYLRRRSVVAPVVSHACFNLLEIVRFVAVGG